MLALFIACDGVRGNYIATPIFWFIGLYLHFWAKTLCRCKNMLVVVLWGLRKTIQD